MELEKFALLRAKLNGARNRIESVSQTMQNCYAHLKFSKEDKQLLKEYLGIAQADIAEMLRLLNE